MNPIGKGRRVTGQLCATTRSVPGLSRKGECRERITTIVDRRRFQNAGLKAASTGAEGHTGLKAAAAMSRIPDAQARPGRAIRRGLHRQRNFRPELYLEHRRALKMYGRFSGFN